MLIPSLHIDIISFAASLSRRVNANSQRQRVQALEEYKLIKKGEC